MTAEEILIDHLQEGKYSETEIEKNIDILNAMQEYASEHCREKDIELSFAYGQIDILKEIIKAQDELIDVIGAELPRTYINQRESDLWKKISKLKKEIL